MTITIVTPHIDNGPVELMIRSIAHNIGNQNEWPEKYGTDYENKVFAMRTECYCGKETCHQCWTELEHGRRAPNFHYKPTDFKVWWYKYIGRDAEIQGEFTEVTLQKIHDHCIESFKTKE